MPVAPPKMVPRINPDILFRYSAKGSVVIMSSTGQDHFWEIHGHAAQLWKSIDGKKSWPMIKRVQATKSVLPKEQFNAKADLWLKKLVKAGLVLEKSAKS